jgi:hypothetical protein
MSANKDHIRSCLLLTAFAACCFGDAYVAGVALLVRWAAQDPEQDPVYRFFQRLIAARRRRAAKADLLHAAHAALDALTDERADAEYKAEAAQLLVEAIRKTERGTP